MIFGYVLLFLMFRPLYRYDCSRQANAKMTIKNYLRKIGHDARMLILYLFNNPRCVNNQKKTSCWKPAI